MSPLSIVIIIVLLYLIFLLIKLMLTDKSSLQGGLQNGQTMSTISASSLATNGSGVASTNFAYSIWFYVNDWNYRYGEPKVIMGRMGSKSSDTNGVIGGGGREPCPAVILGAIENNLSVLLSCYPGLDQVPTDITSDSSILHRCSVTNIPIQKWVNLVVSVFGRTMDIYLDGKLVKTCLLPGVPKINNNADLYVTPKGGFDGWTSKVSYYPSQLNPQDAWNIYAKGPTSWMAGLSSYHVKVSLEENGTTTSSFTF
jgi:hypothetical protein